jgi:23S rRNA (uracil1939-C5)-methyltransferase
VFVDGALPGERVKIEVSEVGRVLRGDLRELVTQSPHRRTPVCPIADRCGGCDWMHVDEATQRKEKEEIVLSALEHLGGFDRSRLQVLPTITGAQAIGYRRRAVLHPVGKQLGFYGRGSHQAVEVSVCPALTEPLRALPGKVSEVLGPALKDLERVQLIEANGKVAVSLHCKDGVKARTREKAEALQRLGFGVVIAPHDEGQVETLGKFELPDGDVRLRPDAFAQANGELNPLLVKAAVDGLCLTGTQSVLELFSGNGNFTVPLARLAGSVVAVESAPVSVQLAQKAAAGMKHVRFMQGDALKVLDGLVKEGRQFDRILVDPPRTGAPGFGKLAALLEPDRLAYVACDPAALARDAEDLFAQGFSPVSLQLFDLFPQTRHIEVVMVMVR